MKCNGLKPVDPIPHVIITDIVNEPTHSTIEYGKYNEKGIYPRNAYAL